MKTTQENSSDLVASDDYASSQLPLILLSGDNARTALMLHHALVNHGFRVRFASSYDELESLWQQQRHPVVLLEVSSEDGVEAAVDTAMQLKRNDPGQFVAYLADPPLRSSGLAGDAIFPRAADQLANALRQHFSLVT